jgi:hypothetical protein
MTDAPQVRTTYSERDVQRILARAAELEAKGNYSVEDVRKIAQEVGIDARALDAAMSEPIPGDDPVVRQTSGTWSPTTAAILAAFGFVAGVLAIRADTGALEAFNLLAVFGPVSVVTFFRAMKHRTTRDLPAFLGDVIALFGGFTLATVGLHGTPALAPSVAWGTFCTALGSAIVSALRFERRAPEGSVAP